MIRFASVFNKPKNIPSFNKVEENSNFLVDNRRNLLIFDKENLLSIEDFFGVYTLCENFEIRLDIYQLRLSQRLKYLSFEFETNEKDRNLILGELQKRGWFFSGYRRDQYPKAMERLSLIFGEIKRRAHPSSVNLISYPGAGCVFPEFYELRIGGSILHLHFDSFHLFVSLTPVEIFPCQDGSYVYLHDEFQKWERGCQLKIAMYYYSGWNGKRTIEEFEKNFSISSVAKNIIGLLLIQESNLCDRILGYFEEENLITLMIESVVKEHTLLLYRNLTQRDEN